MKRLRVTVNGTAYDVTVELLEETATIQHVPMAAPVTYAAPAPAPVQTAPVSVAIQPTPQTPTPAGANDVASPLAGKVVSIDVKDGQAVNVGDQLVTLEAMKMNTYVNAEKAGNVAAILVKPGDAVDEGQALLRLS